MTTYKITLKKYLDTKIIVSKEAYNEPNFKEELAYLKQEESINADSSTTTVLPDGSVEICYYTHVLVTRKVEE